MKKQLSILLTLAMLLCLAPCGSFADAAPEVPGDGISFRFASKEEGAELLLALKKHPGGCFFNASNRGRGLPSCRFWHR